MPSSPAVTRRISLDDGFSFVELLAYMAIAALLILAAIPQFGAYREKANITNLQSDLSDAGVAMEAASIGASRYPSTLPAMPVSPQSTLTLASSSVGAFCVDGATRQGARWHFASTSGVRSGTCAEEPVGMGDSGGGEPFVAVGPCLYSPAVRSFVELAYTALATQEWRNYQYQVLVEAGTYSTTPILGDERSRNDRAMKAAEDAWFGGETYAAVQRATNASYTATEAKIVQYLYTTGYMGHWQGVNERRDAYVGGSRAFSYAEARSFVEAKAASWPGAMNAACSIPLSSI